MDGEAAREFNRHGGRARKQANSKEDDTRALNEKPARTRDAEQRYIYVNNQA
jgi:hypothetical protein